MLIPVGNMNDEGGINANPGAAKLGWLVFSFFFFLPSFFFFHWEKEIKRKENGKSIGDSFVKGISIQTTKYQEKKLRKAPLFGDNVSNCWQAGAGLSAGAGGLFLRRVALGSSECPGAVSLINSEFKFPLRSSGCSLPSQLFPTVLSTAAFAKSNKSHL